MVLIVPVEVDKLLVVEPLDCEPLVVESAPIDRAAEDEKVLCPHCLRTATNGIKCKGICVADSDY
jgi:regulator of extracellular matrix RemA (YlzA/DUF370 family)